MSPLFDFHLPPRTKSGWSTIGKWNNHTRAHMQAVIRHVSAVLRKIGRKEKEERHWIEMLNEQYYVNSFNPLAWANWESTTQLKTFVDLSDGVNHFSLRTTIPFTKKKRLWTFRQNTGGVETAASYIYLRVARKECSDFLCTCHNTRKANAYTNCSRHTIGSGESSSNWEILFRICIFYTILEKPRT